MPNAIPENDLDPALFTATVTSLTHSFGDNTRRKIYLYLRDHPGATAGELSVHCDVHANVVRHHLERLSEAGYVTFDNVRKTTVGRPAKGYRVVDNSLVMDGSMRRDALLVALLEMALERLGPEASEAMAHDVGVEYGRTRLELDIEVVEVALHLASRGTRDAENSNIWRASLTRDSNSRASIKCVE